MENNNATNFIKAAAPTKCKNKLKSCPLKSRPKSKPKPTAKSKMMRPLQDLSNIANPLSKRNPSVPTGIVPSSILAKQGQSSKTSYNFLARQMNLEHINFRHAEDLSHVWISLREELLHFSKGKILLGLEHANGRISSGVSWKKNKQHDV